LGPVGERDVLGSSFFVLGWRETFLVRQSFDGLRVEPARIIQVKDGRRELSRWGGETESGEGVGEIVRQVGEDVVEVIEKTAE